MGDVQEMSNDFYVVVQTGSAAGPAAYVEVTPQLVLRFGDYALVRPVGEDEWLMGMFDRDEASISCWGWVGSDLGAAIDGL
jgi:hypothetical protein